MLIPPHQGSSPSKRSHGGKNKSQQWIILRDCQSAPAFLQPLRGTWKNSPIAQTVSSDCQPDRSILSEFHPCLTLFPISSGLELAGGHGSVASKINETEVVAHDSGFTQRSRTMGRAQAKNHIVLTPIDANAGGNRSSERLQRALETRPSSPSREFPPGRPPLTRLHSPSTADDATRGPQLARLAPGITRRGRPP